jgi:hypothetical protein
VVLCVRDAVGSLQTSSLVLSVVPPATRQNVKNSSSSSSQLVAHTVSCIHTLTHKHTRTMSFIFVCWFAAATVVLLLLMLLLQ